MNENYLVTKSNYFIMNSSYDLSLEEQKIILTLASMVQPEDEEFKSYKFSIKEFRELLGGEDKSKYNTKSIKSLYGFLEDAIKFNYKPSVGKEKVTNSKFANFKEREDWDFKKIEKLARENIVKELEK